MSASSSFLLFPSLLVLWGFFEMIADMNETVN